MRFGLPGVVAWALAASCVFGQPELHLKTRLASGERAAAEDSVSRSMSGERRHWLIQFAERPTSGDIAAIELHGARIASPAPEWGYVISAGPESDLAGLNLARVERIGVRDKLSPELKSLFISGEVAPARQRTANSFVIEFHPDVEPGVARRILSESGLRVLEHSQLLNQHYLVEARPDELTRLAEWDEVAYVFPSSDDLVDGSPIHPCHGALTETGPVGQSVALVGPGWAPGKGSARLNYALGALTQKLDNAKLKAEIRRAFAEWSKYAQIDFSESAQLSAFRTLAFRWGRGASGGPLPFDGPGRMLAYTYYPSPPNPEPVAGDLYFDDDENWQFGADIDAFSVILHEIGHALGLGHSDKPGAVMYPYYRRASGLTDEDVGAVRNLYAARLAGTSPAPQPSAPDPEPPTSTPSTPPVPPAPKPSADRTPPLLTISSPRSATVITSQPAFTITGTASDASGVAQVTWQNRTGSSGIASGIPAWRATVPLIRGINAITIQAQDAAGNVTWRSVIVTRR